MFLLHKRAIKVNMTFAAFIDYHYELKSCLWKAKQVERVLNETKISKESAYRLLQYKKWRTTKVIRMVNRRYWRQYRFVLPTFFFNKI